MCGRSPDRSPIPTTQIPQHTKRTRSSAYPNRSSCSTVGTTNGPPVPTPFHAPPAPTPPPHDEQCDPSVSDDEEGGDDAEAAAPTAAPRRRFQPGEAPAPAAPAPRLEGEGGGGGIFPPPGMLLVLLLLLLPAAEAAAGAVERCGGKGRRTTMEGPDSLPSALSVSLLLVGGCSVLRAGAGEGEEEEERPHRPRLRVALEGEEAKAAAAAAAEAEAAARRVVEGEAVAAAVVAIGGLGVGGLGELGLVRSTHDGHDALSRTHIYMQTLTHAPPAACSLHAVSAACISSSSSNSSMLPSRPTPSSGASRQWRVYASPDVWGWDGGRSV